MGKVLAGRYETLKPLASGGMATVHLGRALGVGGFERLVAIKVMHAHIGAEPDFATMFLDEARLAARIRHPNVVPTLDVQRGEDGLFLVMEYIEGPSLHQLVKALGGKPGAIPLGVTLRVMIDTLSGLHAAHELTDDEGASLELVHRDVSPHNILIGTDGVARITDFGVARAEARLSSTRGGQLKGKIPYMPPEQLMGEAVDRRCDVYGAGAVLWEALVGRRLFKADSDGALLGKILLGPQESPRQIDATVPEAVDRVCMRALASKPAERFPTAADFAEALEQAAAAAGVTVASARAVSTMVDQSGAYRKLHAREIAALKKGVADVPAPSPSVPSGSAPSGSVPGGSAPSGSSPSGSMPTPLSGAEPAFDALPPPRSTPSAASHVTALESALSARVEPPPRRRAGMVVAVLLASALGIAVAVGLWSGLDGSTAAPEMGDASAVGDARPRAATSAVDAESPPRPVAPPRAAESAAPAAPSASAAPAASSAPVAAGPAPATGPTTVAPPRATPPPGPARPARPAAPTRPPPSPTEYDPDRL